MDMSEESNQLENGGKIGASEGSSSSSADTILSNESESGFFGRIWRIFSTLPNGIFAISLFGLFLGMSTTMVYSQLTLFLSNELHITISKVAFIDGLVEFCSFLTRIVAGFISDFTKDRKLLLFVGCGITLFARPMVAFAHSAFMVLGIQTVERIGNGLQATPRDALIADLSDRTRRGRSFGFSRSMKTFGALLGTPIAICIMYFTADNFRTVFLCAVIPVILAIICLLSVKTHKLGEKSEKKRENPFKRKYLKSLDIAFWKLLALALIFELGHFTEHLFPAYINRFLPTTVCGVVSMCVSIGQVLLAFPIGYLADKYGKGKFIRVCMMFMICANLIFIAAPYLPTFGSCKVSTPVMAIAIGALLWGGQLSAIQGLFLTLISEQVHFSLRATAMGVYYCAVGAAYFIASWIGGNIWERFGSHFTFGYSISFSVLALLLSGFLLPKKYLATSHEKGN